MLYAIPCSREQSPLSNTLRYRAPNEGVFGEWVRAFWASAPLLRLVFGLKDEWRNIYNSPHVVFSARNSIILIYEEQSANLCVIG